MTARLGVTLVVTLDTKADEAAFVRRCLEDAGLEVIVIDTGVFSERTDLAEFGPAEVVGAAGADLATLRAARDRPTAIETMSRGAARIVADLFNSGRIAGGICIGGGQGATIGAAAIHALPIGVPKVILSTIAGVEGAATPLIGAVDTCLINSVIDLMGLNSVSRPILANAAAAVAGMVLRSRSSDKGERGFRVAETMFGVTAACVDEVRSLLSAKGFEPIIFAATGNGDRAMEDMVDAGGIDAVVDITISQLGQALIRGSGPVPDRLTAAGRAGLPQAISFGGLDIIVCPTPDRFTADAEQGLRKSQRHSSVMTVVRPTVAESAMVGAEVARRINAASGPVSVVIPLGGFSEYSIPGGPLHDPAADAALLEAFHTEVRKDVPVVGLDLPINDPDFARALVESFFRLIGDEQTSGGMS